jgi:predicted O-methyltransferase YrrM
MKAINFKRFVLDIPVEQVRNRRGLAGPTWNDLRVLLKLLAIAQPRRCLEIGIHRGNTAALLLERGPCIERYVGLDRACGNAPPDAGCLVKDDPRVTLIVRGRGTCEIPAEEVLAAGGPFDWIFIDSDHSYHGVAFDTDYCAPLLAEGGVMVWHDFGVPSQFRPGGALFGVHRFLREEPPTPPVHCFRDNLHTSSVAWRSAAWRKYGFDYYAD